MFLNKYDGSATDRVCMCVGVGDLLTTIPGNLFFFFGDGIVVGVSNTLITSWVVVSSCKPVD
jgi:hypothetical protein